MLVKPENLRGAANICSGGGKHPLAAMFGADETLRGGGLAIYCLFYNAEKRSLDVLKTEFPAEGPFNYPCLTTLLPAAAWYERELHDMFGLVPEGHPDLRPLVLHESFPSDFHPLLKQTPVDCQCHGRREYEMMTSTGEGLFEVPVGPIHAGIIEPGHFRFSQAGEAMLQLDAKLFFTHRGIEKALEGKTPWEAMPIIERICGACSVANSLSFCQAVEKLSEAQVPYRAWLLRTLALELERLYNHVGDTGNICAGVGFSPVISMGARLKEYLMQLNELLTGSRFLRGLIVPGGVTMDADDKILEEIDDVLKEVEKVYADMVHIMWEQANFVNRIRTTGIVRENTAFDLAMVGVGARASGIARDSRKDMGFGIYDELDFDVVVEHSGDVEARIKVRVGEVAQSLSLVRQLIAKLRRNADTELQADLGQLRALEGSWGISESARGDNIHWLLLDENGRLDRCFIRSASYPNWPALTVAVQGDIIPDFPLINKSFELCYACIDR
ncbi:MAG: NADH-quinone oxidoreductase subunit C [Phascolarctobacterium sp.]|uniref:hydrogenase large subunit n=1 Tax=Phascolarctobacterium sp. TaxID=2049039 RepID=UPI0026DB40DB|nr:NADH-quinone oxidoreductase subunit C [Phascolarctobacterium sp.]MDO4921994.1 NADH-quinone oxidoreductase subunit C [Phascolarctobacterium sp.]